MIRDLDYFQKNTDIASQIFLNTPLPWFQRVILRKMFEHPYFIWVACRGGGKTFLLAVFALLRAIFYPRRRIGTISASFRQTKLIWREIKKIYEGIRSTKDGEFLRGCCMREPITANDSCYLEFSNGSMIVGLPLGDGTKIRGERFHDTLLDEVPHIPKDIIDQVITPMSITRPDPMAQELNLTNRSQDIENSTIMASSAYYQFNHFFETYDLYNQLKKTDNSYDVGKTTIKEMLSVPGWVDKKALKHAINRIPHEVYKMEYLCEFIPDSCGFFSASTIYQCKYKCKIKLRPSADKIYVMGVDPAFTTNNFAILVIEVGPPHKVVYIYTEKGLKLEEGINQIAHYTKIYKPGKIILDLGAGGGGIQVMEGLKVHGIMPIDSGEGLNIVEGINFRDIDKIVEMNYSLKSNFEKCNIHFPQISDIEEVDENIRELLEKELISVKISATNTGKLHFDTPRKTEKDRYTALLLANYGAELYNMEEKEEDLPTGFFLDI